MLWLWLFQLLLLLRGSLLLVLLQNTLDHDIVLMLLLLLRMDICHRTDDGASSTSIFSCYCYCWGKARPVHVPATPCRTGAASHCIHTGAVPDHPAASASSSDAAGTLGIVTIIHHLLWRRCPPPASATAARSRPPTAHCHILINHARHDGRSACLRLLLAAYRRPVSNQIIISTPMKTTLAEDMTRACDSTDERWK